MTVLEKVTENPAASELWRFEGGVWWMKPAEQTESVREVANAMKAVGARFVTITASQLPGAEGFRLEYHWDLEGRLLGFAFNIAGNTIASIYDLCEAADWIEREVHEGFGIDFTGREYEPLLLREGDTPGVNLRDVATPKPAAGAAAQEVKQ
ncbi:MAG TPA: NADH-quinone oxidoreductase subunit C [Terracidiphilus sp.]|nr:NADH-quinone oxidoreductase subunit C [Terracidiphilus sp.]